VAVLLGYQTGDAAAVLTWILAVFLSILVHELGHAAAMRAYGLRPWITLYGFGGQTAYDQGYASGAKGSGTWGQVLISAAGPTTGFLLIGVLLLGVALAGYGNRIHFADPWGLVPLVVWPNLPITRFFYDISFICVVWGLVNLLPIYPLDGGHIAREILLWISPRGGIRWSLGLSILAAGAMAAFGLLQTHDWFVALFFGYLAYASYVTLQAYNGHRPW
jgi:stage IV sporulation protein FB